MINAPSQTSQNETAQQNETILPMEYRHGFDAGSAFASPHVDVCGWITQGVLVLRKLWAIMGWYFSWQSMAAAELCLAARRLGSPRHQPFYSMVRGRQGIANAGAAKISGDHCGWRISRGFIAFAIRITAGDWLWRKLSGGYFWRVLRLVAGFGYALTSHALAIYASKRQEPWAWYRHRGSVIVADASKSRLACVVAAW